MALQILDLVLVKGMLGGGGGPDGGPQGRLTVLDVAREHAEEFETCLRQLDEAQNLNQTTRLGSAWGEMNWYHQKHGREMDGIARIRCKFKCAGRFVYRLTCWKAPRPEATHVYRIPGLLFDDTVPEGVGIVVCGKRIIGKMAYGTPACSCRHIESPTFG